MTITVNMSKEEFMDYCSYKDVKSYMKCGIIELTDGINKLLGTLLQDGIWEDNNKYDKQIKLILNKLNQLERGVEHADSEVSSESIQ